MNTVGNNKGFTLVEILVVIVLISLLLGLGIPGVMKLSDNMKKRSLNTKINMIENAATVWGNNNKTLLRNTKCQIAKEENKEYDCYKATVKELIEDDYLNSEVAGDVVYNDPYNNSMLDNCVFVYKKNNRVYVEYQKDVCS